MEELLSAPSSRFREILWRIDVEHRTRCDSEFRRANNRAKFLQRTFLLPPLSLDDCQSSAREEKRKAIFVARGSKHGACSILASAQNASQQRGCNARHIAREKQQCISTTAAKSGDHSADWSAARNRVTANHSNVKSGCGGGF